MTDGVILPGEPSLGVDLLDQPPRRVDTGIGRVQEMRREDEERAIADGIGGAAVDLGLVRGKVGDTAVVLLVLGVAEEDDALDLVLDGRVELADGVGDDRRALAVSTSDNRRVGTLGVCQGEETLALVDGVPVRAGGQQVGSQLGLIGASDALNPEVVAKLGF